MDELTILGATAHVGYGIPELSLRNAVNDFDLDVICADAGTTDAGPYYLGAGEFLSARESIRRDLTLLLRTREETNVPLLIGSLHTGGSNEQLDEIVEMVTDIAAEEGFSFTLSTIHTDVGREFLKDRLDDVTPLTLDEEVGREDVDEAANIVSQVGPRPFVSALEKGAEVVLSGRSLDVSPFSAVPIRDGYDTGLAVHLAKIIECGAAAATPRSGTDCMIGILNENYFEVVPASYDRKATVSSVRTHALHEQSNPELIHLPDGTVDISESKYERVSDRRVRISGSEFRRDEKYAVKLEGAEKIGHRVITPAGTRCPVVASEIDRIFDDVEQRVSEMVAYPDDDYVLTLRKFGDGTGVVLSADESDAVVPESNELGVIIDVVGKTKAVARAASTMARSSLVHHDFEGRLNLKSNVAFPYSPSEIDAGEVYRFSIYHLLEGVDPSETAAIGTREVR